MKIIEFFFFLATLVATSHARCLVNPIRLLGDIPLDLEDCIPNPIHVLRPKSGSGGLSVDQINCQSWRLSVETDNLQNWSTIPSNCIDYVGHYMLGKQYRKDCDVVGDIAINYTKNLTPASDGKDVWVFDIDETALSNAPYYARSDVAFGALPYNDTKFNEWVAEGTAPPVPAVLRLYEEIIKLGFKAIFLSGTKEKYREPRVSNLKNVGYTTWEDLILKGDDDSGETAVVYKSKKRTQLVAKGYRIIGNVGDQWSDLTGTNVGKRTFKIPDPMYYIA